MKNAMVKREKIGKISSFLRSKGFSTGSQSESRKLERGTSKLPSSTKIGAGQHIHRIRSLKQL